MVAKEHTLSFLQINWIIYSCFVLLLDLGMLQRQEIVASEGVFENPVFKIWGTSWWPLLLGRKAPPSFIHSDRAISDCLHQKPTIFLYGHIQDSQNHALQTHLLWHISQSSDAVYAVYSKLWGRTAPTVWCLVAGNCVRVSPPYNKITWTKSKPPTICASMFIWSCIRGVKLHSIGEWNL